MFAGGSAQKNFKVQPKYLQSQCLDCQASVSHLVSRIEQFHTGQPPAAPEGGAAARGAREFHSSGGELVLTSSPCLQEQAVLCYAVCAGKALALPEVSTLLLWLLGRATGAVTVAGGTLVSLFLELSFQIVPKSLRSHCVFLATGALGNDAGAWRISSWCQ